MAKLTYDRAIAGHYARYRGVRTAVLRRLIDGAAVGGDSRVLDVGCGTGDYIIALQAATGCTAHGIDISEEMLNFARRRSAAVDFAAGAAEFLDFPDASLDLVFNVDVVHHLMRPVAHFGEAHRVLKPGGHVCTMTHSEDMFRNTMVLSRYFPETVDVNLTRYPTPQALRADLAAAGFHDPREGEISYPAEVRDSGLYASKSYSPLHLISEDAFARGLARLEADLAEGPIRGTRRYLLLWAVK